MVNSWVDILILKMEENMENFQYIMLCYFTKGKNAKKKKRFVQCMEKVLWLTECGKSGLWSFMLESSCRVMLQGQVDQSKLIAINRDIDWGKPTLYHMEESWHIQYIQSNKVIGENEKKYAIYFMEKAKWTFWPTQYPCISIINLTPK